MLGIFLSLSHTFSILCLNFYSASSLFYVPSLLYSSLLTGFIYHLRLLMSIIGSSAFDSLLGCTLLTATFVFLFDCIACNFGLMSRLVFAYGD